MISVGFSPDGKLLASSGFDDPIRLWDPVTGEHIRTIDAAHGPIRFSPDGKWLTGWTVEAQSKQLLWEVATGNVVATANERREALGVAFVPDSKNMALMLPGGVLRLWDPVTSQESARIQLPVKDTVRRFRSPERCGPVLYGNGAPGAPIARSWLVHLRSLLAGRTKTRYGRWRWHGTHLGPE